MPAIRGRSLRPPVCSCLAGCVSKQEMRARHGDPEEFLEALTKAFEAGDVSFDEAERANLMYRAEWGEAPETTEVEK